jgi:two-component system, cell cycle sensor histidine kinase PleC
MGTATVSHELRTPLNAIIGFSEMLEQEFLGPLGAREYVEYARFVREGGETLLGLINGIIELSAVEAGEYVIRKEPVDLVRVVATCLRSIDAAAQMQGVTLINTISHLPGIVANERAIRQVLLQQFSMRLSRVCIVRRRWRCAELTRGHERGFSRAGEV